MAYTHTYRSAHALGKLQMPSPNGSEVVNVMTKLTMTNDEVDALVADDIIYMGYLPEDCALVDAIAADTDLDTGNGLDLDFGIINDDEDDWETDGELQNSILVAGTTHAARLTQTVETLTTVTDGKTRKKLGFKVATAATTAAAGTLYLSLTYRSATLGA